MSVISTSNQTYPNTNEMSPNAKLKVNFTTLNKNSNKIQLFHSFYV
jgi:hypothetical protein